MTLRNQGVNALAKSSDMSVGKASMIDTEKGKPKNEHSRIGAVAKGNGI